jgi:integrase
VIPYDWAAGSFVNSVHGGGVSKMASVKREGKAGRVGWRVRFYADKRSREIYLAVGGKRGETMAKKIAGHVENLAQSKSKNVPADPMAIQWANGTDGSLRENLIAWGLAEPHNHRLATDAGRLLGAFIDSYIGSRSDIKQTTIINYKQTRRLLVEYFGESKSLQSITPADAERWKRWLLDRLATASTCKHIKRAKTFFSFAVDDRLLSSSPFSKIKAGDDVNPDRQRFIDRKMSEKILAACPDADWRTIFALARFGALRCPSEVLGLRWSDVDWDGGRLRIDSPKTGLRYCPLFPELRGTLSEAFDLAADGAVHVVARYRQGQNLRTQLNRIIQSAAMVPWPKPFNNLRASRRTELQEMFPSHVIDSWLGHSTKVAERHYLQVTDDHWEAAIKSCPPTRPHINPDSDTINTNHENDKTPRNTTIDASRGLEMLELVTPTGLEPVLPP